MSLTAAPNLLDDAVHPVLRAVAGAPLVRALTPEQRAELDQAVADIAAGRVQLVPHEDVERALAQMGSEQNA
jgi:hypothetical protein